MPLNMRIESTNVTSVPEDVAKELVDAYATLKELPSTKMLTTDPFDGEGYTGPKKIDGKDVTEEYKAAANARVFVRQGKAWAESQTGDNGRPLVFVRKGDVKSNPTVVSFRIYEQREQTEETAS
jgi:hypothetical protein